MSGALHGFAVVVRRDLLLAVRRSSDVLQPPLFFVVVVSLFPFAVGAEPNLLARIAPGIIWVAALLATLLSLDGLFRSDFDDGTLEQMLLSPQPLPVLTLAKITAHWLITGLPLIVTAPLLGVLLSLPDEAMGVLVLTLMLGTPVLSLVGAIGIALTVGLRRGGALLALLVLPLYVPVLIFGAQAVSAASIGLPVSGQLYMMGALLALAVSLAPLATAAALRVSLD